MLSIGTASEVRQAIAAGDVKFIQQTNGVGKKVAERVIIELKDKVGLAGVDIESTGLLQSDTAALRDEAVEALVALGYTANDAVRALQQVDPGLPTEDRIKQALSGAAT
jgi:Holliday junction DNA helicase RuvA